MATSKKAVSSKNAAAALQGKSAVVAYVPGKLQLPEGFKAVRALQLPTLVMKTVGEGRVLGFLSGLRVSTVAPKEKKGEVKEAHATIATVVDIQTGEQMIFLVPAVVEGVFQDTYCNVREKPARLDYEAREAVYTACNITGKTFYIRNDGKPADKPSARHVNFTVIEGEPMSVSPAK